MKNKKDIAGLVILYNSPLNVLANIATYIEQIDILYVVDNSIFYNTELVEIISKKSRMVYHSLCGNKGIAVALNWAAKRALHDGYSLLLTMDDDTKVPPYMIESMLAFWNNDGDTSHIGLLSGVHYDKISPVKSREVLYTLTSGNLLNLEAFAAINGFKDELFIDHVDHEYCFRLNDNKYRVVELPQINLIHKLGYSKSIKIGNMYIRNYGTNSPERLYYYARNGLHIAKVYFFKHPSFAWTYTKEMIRRWIKTIFLDDNKLMRVNMLYKGMKDGLHGKLGKYEPN